MSKKSISNAVCLAYRKVTEIGNFDVIQGNKVIDFNDELEIVPKKFHDHVDNNQTGCCLVFATYMLKELHDEGFSSHIIFTKEGNGIRGSLLYFDDGEYFVANPVQDIECFTSKGLSKEERESLFVKDSAATRGEDGSICDNSRIPLQEFADRYGDVRYFSSYYDDNVRTFSKAFKRAYLDEMIIASPEEKCELAKKKNLT